MTELTSIKLLHLLQISNSALPIGAYSYSEGLETLIELQIIKDANDLKSWLIQELKYGAIRTETAVMTRAFQATQRLDLCTFKSWNNWFSAARETEEMRQQSWQMGYSLLRLIEQIEPATSHLVQACGNPCNYAVAFGTITAYWEIDLTAATLAYLQSWALNLINAAVKLIPLGQTTGQKLLLDLNCIITTATEEILDLQDDDLCSCGWGLSLASMNHEILYTRLFRS
ncbi:urease accessory protein UreF [Merismopedia glauca]|uniref:Urease accessory protein UreF n=1 Tax=Merismopedia glauca CCAP 1448/3 TaxID=1296344 RepID=A0A2T1C3Z7_9CYAN|nr:urease accessory protein UreF [Merismopedia glauca]PSB03002.1 urease accessory protein UreF [Merismopedia glauca CCAP 1448/3]